MRAIPLIALLGLWAAAVLAACGAAEPQPDASRRTWRGPSQSVSSQGVTRYQRREIAQQVSFPTCLTVGATAFRFDAVHDLPPGTFDTGYSLDRWRLLSFAGALEEQPRLFVTALGSTGIVADYPRLPAGGTC